MALHPRPRDGHRTRTADPVALSGGVIEEGVADEPTNRGPDTLAVITDDIALMESFSHMVAVRTDRGLVSFDASLLGKGIAAAVRESRAIADAGIS